MKSIFILLRDYSEDYSSEEIAAAFFENDRCKEEVSRAIDEKYSPGTGMNYEREKRRQKQK